MSAATQNEMERLERVNREQLLLLDQVWNYVDQQGLGRLGQSKTTALIEAHQQTVAALGSAKQDVVSLLYLLADIRAAAGDPEGKMMQPELVAHIQEMRDVLIQERADMRRTGGGISSDTIGRMQAVIVAAGGGE